MYYLRYVCLHAYSGIVVLCFCFPPMLPVFLDCSFLIALSVFSNVYSIPMFADVHVGRASVLFR